jgi:hypothetical protein
MARLEGFDSPCAVAAAAGACGKRSCKYAVRRVGYARIA